VWREFEHTHTQKLLEREKRERKEGEKEERESNECVVKKKRKKKKDEKTLSSLCPSFLLPSLSL
jgi:hypothetical protein